MDRASTSAGCWQPCLQLELPQSGPCPPIWLQLTRKLWHRVDARLDIRGAGDGQSVVEAVVACPQLISYGSCQYLCWQVAAMLATQAAPNAADAPTDPSQRRCSFTGYFVQTRTWLEGGGAWWVCTLAGMENGDMLQEMWILHHLRPCMQ